MLDYFLYLVLSISQSYIDQYLIVQLQLSIYILILVQSLFQIGISYVLNKDPNIWNKEVLMSSVIFKCFQYQFAIILYMKMVQTYPISMISSFSLFSPNLTWIILVLIQTASVAETFKNTIQNVIAQSFSGKTGVYVDDAPLILYIRKSENEPFSKKVTDFSLILDNSYSFLQNNHQFLVSYENSLNPALYLQNTTSPQAFLPNETLKGLLIQQPVFCHNCSYQSQRNFEKYISQQVIVNKDHIVSRDKSLSPPFWVKPQGATKDDLCHVVPDKVPFEARRRYCQDQQPTCCMKSRVEDVQQGINSDLVLEIKKQINTEQILDNNADQEQFGFHVEDDQYKQFGVQVNPLDDRLDETQLEKLKLSHIDEQSCFCNSNVYNGILLVASTLCVVALVFGSSALQAEVNYLLMVVYVVNQSFGSVLSQFSKSTPPFTQIMYVNISIIPLVIWLIVSKQNTAQMQNIPINSPFGQISGDSYLWYISLVLIILVAQSSQLLATYIKINFFQKHPVEYQVKLLYIPIIIKILIDILLKGIWFSSIQQLGLIGITLIGIIQLGDLIIQELKPKQFKLDDDYIQV